MFKVPPPDSVARYVKWGLMLFFAYVLWHSSFHALRPSPVPPGTAMPQAHATGKDKDCGNKSGNALENFPLFNIPLIPTSVPQLHIEDSKEGAGEGAICGQYASIRAEYALKNGDVLFKSNAARSVTLGSGLLPGVAHGLIGMKAGGERTIQMSPMLAFAKVTDIHAALGGDAKVPPGVNLEEVPVSAKVALLALSPEPPSSPMPLKFIDGLAGNGARAACGDTVRADITIWKMDGTKLFSTLSSGGPVTFTLGDSKVPYGIEQGVAGMMPGGRRTLIVPPAFAKPLKEEMAKHLETPLIDTKFPDNEMVLVEIARLADVEEQPKMTTSAPQKKPAKEKPASPAQE